MVVQDSGGYGGGYEDDESDEYDYNVGSGGDESTVEYEYDYGVGSGGDERTLDPGYETPVIDPDDGTTGTNEDDWSGNTLTGGNISDYGGDDDGASDGELDLTDPVGGDDGITGDEDSSVVGGGITGDDDTNVTNDPDSPVNPDNIPNPFAGGFLGWLSENLDLAVIGAIGTAITALFLFLAGKLFNVNVGGGSP